MKSLLEELSDIPVPRKTLVLSLKGENIVESAINLFSELKNEFDEEVCDVLLKKFILSIKKEDPQKFMKKLNYFIQQKNRKNNKK